MPRLRKNEPVMLNDEELYALMRASFHHHKVQVWKPVGSELKVLKDAHAKLEEEFWARAKEEQRIETELKLLEDEYEGRAS